MAAANVQIRITTDGPAQATDVSAPGLFADVTSEFDLHCSAAPREGADLDMVFPLEYTGEKLPATIRFAVAVDGKPVPDVQPDTWPATDEKGKAVSQWGYTWRLSGLKSGQKRRVIVSYSIALPQHEGKAHFTYILRSGAGWAGPIGHESVNVAAQKGLRMEVSSPVALKPEKRTDGSLTWTIVKAKPSEDIRLVIVPEAKQ